MIHNINIKDTVMIFKQQSESISQATKISSEHPWIEAALSNKTPYACSN